MPARYRADHIGSLLRPAELLQARNANSDTAQLRALEDKHILRVIERQKDLGFKIFTDGELRRGNFMSDFNDAVEGIDEGVAVARTWKTQAGASPRPSMVPGTVVAKIKQTRRLTGHEFAFVKQHSPGDVKVTLPTANQFPAIYYKKGISEALYSQFSTPSDGIFVFHQISMSCNLESTSSRNYASIFYGVLDCSQTISYSILNLSDCVLSWSYQ